MVAEFESVVKNKEASFFGAPGSICKKNSGQTRGQLSARALRLSHRVSRCILLENFEKAENRLKNRNYIWVILRKTAYFSNEILKEKNVIFSPVFTEIFSIYVLEAIFNIELSHIHWGWEYSGQKIE